MAAVTFDRVSLVYPGADRPSVDSVDLEIADGEFLVLVGPSGCGKSTTLRMLAGLEQVSSGTIYLDADDVTEADPKDRDIAMVFQNYALYPHLSVRENMSFALKMKRRPKAEIKERVEKAAEMLGLTEFLDRKPKALSGGPVTVAIARFSGDNAFEQPYAAVMAAGTLVTIPLVIMVLIFQRRIVSGLTAGGVKS